jgi:uncharacterized protein YigE (DUF2233 family)
MDARRSYGVVAPLFLLAVSACHHDAAVPAAEAQDAAPSASSAPSPSPAAMTDVSAEGESFRAHAWTFATADVSFAIVDLGMHRTLEDALGPGDRLAINGGFFDTDGAALGLTVSRGKRLSRFSETMSGGVFSITHGIARVDATEDYDATRAVDFAVQCRPRLVVAGKANVKRSDGHGAERTALCVREGGRTVEVVVAIPAGTDAGPSLFAMGHYLAEQLHCDDALNLDGGPSTGAAYRAASSDAAVSRVTPRGPLRHAVVVATGDAG